jgi:hypothetical protein
MSGVAQRHQPALSNDIIAHRLQGLELLQRPELLRELGTRKDIPGQIFTKAQNKN